MAKPKVTKLIPDELTPEASIRSMVATWTWDKSNTDHFNVRWQYSTGVGVLIPGSDSTVDGVYRVGTWSAPAEANAVRVQVQAIAKTHKVNNTDTPYWADSDWSDPVIYYFNDNPPVIPPVPDVQLDDQNKCRLRMAITGMTPQGVNLSYEDDINFRIVQLDKDGNSKVYKTGTSKITWNGIYGSAYYTCVVTGGYRYRVQAQSRKAKQYSRWSDLSSVVITAPDEAIELAVCRVDKIDSDKVVYLKWSRLAIADRYQIRYATNEAYFDTSDNVTVIDINEPTNNRNITGLEPGTYYFQVRAGNESGYGGWSNTKSVTMGAKPLIPTTWSDVTSAIAEAGSHVTLYWRHNPKDGSKETKATIEVTVGSTVLPYIEITDPVSEDDDDSPHTYQLDISGYSEGTKIRWRVKTAGADQTDFSDWSITREIDVYTRPDISIRVTDGDDSTLSISIDEEIPYTAYNKNLYTNTIGSVVDIENPNSVSPWRFWVIPVETGDTFIIRGYGGSKPRLWAFLDSDCVVLSNSVENKNAKENPVEVTAASDGYLVVNSNYADSQVIKHTVQENVLTAFPFYIKAMTTPPAQKPLGYSVDIIANETYVTTDSLGKEQTILEGSSVYSNYFIPSSDPIGSFNYWYFELMLSAGNVDLQNAISYTINVEVTMDSGLRASDSYTFTVSWSEDSYEPDAELLIDMETLTANIRPYCVDEDDELIEGVTLAVYRREYDGSFTEIMTDIPNENNYFITDPHPALDYARYRIVARVEATGAVSFNDLIGYPVKEKAVVIQWDEDWTNFEAYVSDRVTDAVDSVPPWSGSMLKLPYNIDITENRDPEVSLVSYIGRSHPVSYYGTQKGESRTVNLEIPAYDTETLYQIRRLAAWMGDVYIRDPSGVGYWATVKVSFSKTHLNLVIPISFTITRVEGGV